jgi:hypothetical protein
MSTGVGGSALVTLIVVLVLVFTVVGMGVLLYALRAKRLAAAKGAGKDGTMRTMALGAGSSAGSTASLERASSGGGRSRSRGRSRRASHSYSKASKESARYLSTTAALASVGSASRGSEYSTASATRALFVRRSDGSFEPLAAAESQQFVRRGTNGTYAAVELPGSSTYDTVDTMASTSSSDYASSVVQLFLYNEATETYDQIPPEVSQYGQGPPANE